MSLLFVETTENWEPVELNDSESYRLSQSDGAVKVSALSQSVSVSSKSDLVIQRSASQPPQWVLISHPGACRVNSAVNTSGIESLAHKDEIVLAKSDQRVLFSLEVIARITIYKASGEPVACPRCTRPIENGMPVVACPSCGVFMHEDPENGRNCWTFTDKCAVCLRATSLDTGCTFPPEGW